MPFFQFWFWCRVALIRKKIRASAPFLFCGDADRGGNEYNQAKLMVARKRRIDAK